MMQESEMMMTRQCPRALKEGQEHTEGLALPGNVENSLIRAGGRAGGAVQAQEGE